MGKRNKSKVVSLIANIVSTVILIFSILICVLVIASMKSSSGVASLFGYSVLSVKSDSMEPTFYPGDLIIIKRTGPKARFQKGDIVSFEAYDNIGIRFINTHRIEEVVKGETRDRYTTKGDNAERADVKKLYSSNIIGIYTGTRVGGLGKAIDFINSPIGVLMCVVVPSAVIIIAQVISYASAASRRKRELLAEAEERARTERIQLVNDVVAAQRGVMGGVYVPQVSLDPDLQMDEPEKQRVIEEYLAKQAQEEAKKQAIIEEYLRKQKEAEEAKKEEMEAEKIKAIIAEFLAQQQAAQSPPQEKGTAEPEPPPEEEGSADPDQAQE